jgi:hypothetical protein
MFAIVLVENLDPQTPMRERLLSRYRSSIDMIADGIRLGQDDGRYRTDLDPRVKAMEILAFITGMEMSWLLDRSISVAEVFQEYSTSLARQLAPPADAS